MSCVAVLICCKVSLRYRCYLLQRVDVCRLTSYTVVTSDIYSRVKRSRCLTTNDLYWYMLYFSYLYRLRWIARSIHRLCSHWMSQALVMIKYSPPFAGKLLNKLAAEFISLSKLYIYNILIYTARNANPISFKFVKPFEISNYNVLI